MIYGMYLSAQGAEVQSARQEAIANNLANASTTAFKRDLLRFQSHRPYDVRQGNGGQLPNHLSSMPGGVSVKDSVTDFTPGAVNATKGPLDVAISGSGFFKVSDGKQSYLTRDGQFSMNARGELVTTQHGLQVLGSGNAPITGIDPSRPVRIDIDGSIRQGEDFISQLQVVEPENLNDLHKAGRNLYSTQGRQRPVNPDNSPVQQGFLEASTVNPVSEMTQIIETSRAFEANINMIKHQDEALGRLLSSLPRK
jgi:flagellar basal-body rod protein FlgF